MSYNNLKIDFSGIALLTIGITSKSIFQSTMVTTMIYNNVKIGFSGMNTCGMIMWHDLWHDAQINFSVVIVWIHILNVKLTNTIVTHRHLKFSTPDCSINVCTLRWNE